MQVVKKGIKLIISVVGIVLFCACTKRVPVSVVPVETPTPTQKVSVTITPFVTETISPTETVASPTKEPTEVVTETPLPTETKTPTLTPTKKPDPTATKEPTSTKPPTSTSTPLPTKEPTITSGISATGIPTTVVTPESLIANGWQSMLDISQTYCIIFSECFNESKVTKDETILDICYTSTQEENIKFQVLYLMEQTLNHVLDKVVEQGGVVLEENSLEKSITYQLEEESMIYQGVILEKEYKKELLGDGFGEEDSIVGTMQIVFAYPKEQQAKYETDAFNYYIVRIP